MSKVLITGGAGFIGFNLAKKLLFSGYEVDLIDNLSRGQLDDELKYLLDSNSKLRFIVDDLLHPKKLCEPGGYSYIYHLAAIVGVANVVEKPYQVLVNNLIMHKNILEFAKAEKNLKRFVFSSTSEVYAGTLKYFGLKFPTPEDTPLTINTVDDPRATYMLSKIYGEALCQHSGLPFSIIRPHNIYGPRMGFSHVIPELLLKVYKANDGVEVYSVDHKRTFCYIDDAAEFIRRIAENESCNGLILNVGNEKPEVKIGDLARLIIQITNKSSEIIPLEPTPGSPVRRVPDMSKTHKLTGYSSKTSLEDGVMKMNEWFLDHVK